MRVRVLETASKKKTKEKRIIHKDEVQNEISCQTNWIIKRDGEEDPASSRCSSPNSLRATGNEIERDLDFCLDLDLDMLNRPFPNSILEVRNPTL